MARDVVYKSYVPQTIRAIDQGTEKGMIENAVKIVTTSKSLSPVKEGQLRGGAMWKSHNDSGLFESVEGAQPLQTTPKKGEVLAGSAVEHDIYQEFGTRFMAPNPHWRPAAEEVTRGRRANDTMREYQDEYVDRVLGR